MKQKHINQFTQEELRELMSATKSALASIADKINDVTCEVIDKNNILNKTQLTNLLLRIEVSIMMVIKELCVFYDDNFDAKTNSEILEDFTSIIKNFKELQKEIT